MKNNKIINLEPENYKIQSQLYLNLGLLGTTPPQNLGNWARDNILYTYKSLSGGQNSSIYQRYPYFYLNNMSEPCRTTKGSSFLSLFEPTRGINLSFYGSYPFLIPQSMVTTGPHIIKGLYFSEVFQK